VPGRDPGGPAAGLRGPGRGAGRAGTDGSAQKQVLLEIYDSFRREAAAQAPEDLEDAAIAAEAAAIQAAAAEATAAQAAERPPARRTAEAAGAVGPARGAWKQATSPDGAGSRKKR